MDQNMKSEIHDYLRFMADKADKLIGNFTTNLVESWMGLRSMFVCLLEFNVSLSQ